MYRQNAVFIHSYFNYMRVLYFFLLTIISSITIARSQTKDPATGNGKLLSQETYTLPSYEDAVARTDAENYATRQEYEKAINDKNFDLSRIKYSSDGLKVNAYLYKPASTAGKLPVIVFNRGSFVRGDIAPELITMFHRLASEGFAVIAPMYRQSDGAEGKDEMGGGDLNDLMNVVPLLRSFSFIDTANIFMYGESRGGVMTYLAMKRQFPIKAAAVFGAITNMNEYLTANARGFTLQVLNQIWPGYDQNKATILKDRSALEWPAEINAPVFIMHGGGDRSVNPLQSLQFAEKLQVLGKRYQLKIYYGDNHILAKNRLQRDQETVGWLKSFIK
jgi:dipeptidyl aminopeptidase/acylaminoacyl peptidase